MPTLSTLRLENRATPATAATVVVPERVPPGLVPSAIVTFPAKLFTALPAASCAVTCTAGVTAVPAVVLPGCTVKASCVGAMATRKSASASGLAPKKTHGLTRPVWSTLRACQ